MPHKLVNKMGENRGQDNEAFDNSLGIDECRIEDSVCKMQDGNPGRRTLSTIQPYLSPSQSLTAQYRLNSQLKPLERNGGYELGLWLGFRVEGGEGGWGESRALSGPCAFLCACDD